MYNNNNNCNNNNNSKHNSSNSKHTNKNNSDNIINNNNEKIKSICKFEFIDQVKSKNIDQNNKDSILELIAINLFKVEEKFEISLLFKNKAFITLFTEVLEVTLQDQESI